MKVVAQHDASIIKKNLQTRHKIHTVPRDTDK